MDFFAFDNLYRHRPDFAPEPAETSAVKLAEDGLPELVPIIETPHKPWPQLLERGPQYRRKYRLWEEVHGMCIYCGCGISAQDFVEGVDSDIEHIIPQCMGGGTTFDNTTMSCRVCNRQKGDLTAIDYMLSQSAEQLRQYLQRLRLLAAAGSISHIKYRLLLTPKELVGASGLTAEQTPVAD